MTRSIPRVGDHLDRSGYELEVEDRFETDTLDERLWFPYHLPHWSSRAQAAARYDVGGGELRLRIDRDQPPWNPEFDGSLRVSSIQTAERAGPLGSREGVHRFRPDVVVREAQPTLSLYTPHRGLVEIRLRARDDPTTMVALWLIGIEDEPVHSAEICVCEIFGRDVGPGEARIGMGVHPFGDATITDDFEAVPVAIDAREPHEYAAAWTTDHVAFAVDGRIVKVVEQSPDYPMQCMLGLYEFAEGPEPPSPPDSYPKTVAIEWFRGWR